MSVDRAENETSKVSRNYGVRESGRGHVLLQSWLQKLAAPWVAQHVQSSTAGKVRFMILLFVCLTLKPLLSFVPGPAGFRYSSDRLRSSKRLVERARQERECSQVLGFFLFIRVEPPGGFSSFWNQANSDDAAGQ